MNSHVKRKVNASSASTTRFMPARKAGIEGQHAPRRLLVPAIAEPVQARRRAAEIDHHEKERRQCVEPKMRAEPGHADRERQRLAAGIER